MAVPLCTLMFIIREISIIGLKVLLFYKREI